MLDEAMKMKDKGRAMTKAEAANATIQNARKALVDVQTAISNREEKEDINLPGVSPIYTCLCSGHKSCNFIMLH